MGYQATWIARIGRSTDHLISASRRVPTGERVQHPSDGYYLLELSSETPWVVLVAYGAEFLEDLDAEQAQALSEDGSKTLHFVCSDSVMATKLECFENGSKAWSVEYDCEDECSPVLTGEVPPFTQDILNRLVAEQETDSEVDFVYELTAELGSKLIGFRHDSSPSKVGSEAFQALRFESESRDVESRDSEPRSTDPASPRGPLDELFRKLVLSGTLLGMPVKKSAGRLMIGSQELGVEAVEGDEGQIRLTFLEEGKTLNFRGSMARCVEKIHSFCSPAARHKHQS